MKDRVPEALFICVGNAARSQMAEAFFNQLAQGRARAVSAGTRPEARVAPAAVAVMRELGIDISGQRPKPLTAEIIEQADRVISLGCGVAESCPVELGARIDEDWGLEDPAAGGPVEKVREIRDDIRRRVTLLLEELDSAKHRG